MTPIKPKYTVIIANKLEQTWISKYLWMTKIILDQGTEFIRDVIEMIEKDYRITRQPITTQNPQANSIIECGHQHICNIQHMELDLDNPWSGIMSEVFLTCNQ